MVKSIRNIFKIKPSSLLLLILAIGTLISVYFNYQNNKLFMSGIGMVISTACFWLFFKEKKEIKNDEK